MKKVLIPIDGTERGMKAIEFFKGVYTPDQATVILMTVDENLGPGRVELDYTVSKEKMSETLSKGAALLAGYKVHEIAGFSRAADQILDTAESEKVDAIIMTKSTRMGYFKTLGSTAVQIVKHAPCLVMIVPE